jgi:hypothetical protein
VQFSVETSYYHLFSCCVIHYTMHKTTRTGNVSENRLLRKA